MWIIRWVVIAIVIIFIIGFAMQNTGELVQVRFINWQSVPIPLWAVMYASFVVGILLWLLISVFQILALKNDRRRNRRQIKKLKDELDRLRNVTVEETIMPIDKTLPGSESVQGRTEE